jgi:hypothetical protein
MCRCTVYNPLLLSFTRITVFRLGPSSCVCLCRPAAPPPADAGLPEGWQAALDDQGRQYYYHHPSKTSQWEPPARNPQAGQPPLAMQPGQLYPDQAQQDGALRRTPRASFLRAATRVPGLIFFFFFKPRRRECVRRLTFPRFLLSFRSYFLVRFCWLANFSSQAATNATTTGRGRTKVSRRGSVLR